MIQAEDVLKPTSYISSPAKAGSQGIKHTHTHIQLRPKKKKKKVEEKKPLKVSSNKKKLIPNRDCCQHFRTQTVVCSNWWLSEMLQPLPLV